MAPKVPVKLRSTLMAYGWLLALGQLGAHKFYLGRPGWGIAYACTLGFLGVGSLYDLFTLPSQVRAANMKSLYEAGVFEAQSTSAAGRYDVEDKPTMGDPDEVVRRYLEQNASAAAPEQAKPRPSTSNRAADARPVQQGFGRRTSMVRSRA